MFLSVKMNYNHPRWPSPRAKIVAKNLKLDYEGYFPLKMKRLTHAQALELLRKKANKDTIEEFLAMPEIDAWRALGCVSKHGIPFVYNPLYGPRKFW